MGTIIQLFSRNNQRGFEALLAPHVEYLYRLAYRFTGQRADAEDLVQDLLVKLYPRRAELEHIEQLRPWLTRTLYHHFIDQVRRSERNPLHNALDIVPELDGGVGADPMSAGATESGVLQRQIATALAKLNPDQRVVVSLHDMEGYTLQELQAMLDTPIGTLKSRLHRARAALRETLRMEPLSPPERYTGERTSS